MERYFAKLCVFRKGDGHYIGLSIMFMSYKGEFVEATHEAEIFRCGLQLLPNIERVTIESVFHHGNAEDSIWVYDKLRLRKKLDSLLSLENQP